MKRCLILLAAFGLAALLVVLYLPQQRATQNGALSEAPAVVPVIPSRTALQTISPAPALPGPNLPNTPGSAIGAFTNWLVRYTTATPALKPSLESEGVALAEARRVELYELIHTNPQAALAVAVPYTVRRELPPALTRHLEQEVSARGSLTLYFATPPPGQENTCSEPVIRIAKVGGVPYYAYTYGRRLQQLTTAETPLVGIVVDDRLAMSETPYRRLETPEILARQADQGLAPCPHCQQSIAGKSEPVGWDVGGRIVAFCEPAAAAAWLTTPDGQTIWADGGFGGTGTNSPVIPPTQTQGDKKFLFMRVRFADDSPTYEPETDAQVRSDLDDVMRRYASMSYGTLQGSYGFTPTMTLPKPRSAYMNGFSDVDGMWALMNDAKTAAGLIEEPPGSGLHPYHPNNYSLFAARWNGEPGGCCSWGGGSHAWIRWDGSDVLVHEWGHGIGLPHANFWDCTTDDPIGPGSHVEYGNNFDNMGSGGIREYSAMFKAMMNWLTPSNVWTVTSNGTYRIFVHDQPILIPANRYAAKISRISRNNYNYWLEFRNNTVSGANAVYWANGVGVMREQDWELLDMTPGSSLSKEDCTLTIGRTYYDPTAGISLTPVAKGTLGQNYIDVYINLDDSRLNHPPVSLVRANSYTPGIGATVTLIATGADPDGDTLAYAWDFGDGNVSFNNAPVQTKSWSAAGNYVVHCVVSDRRGGISSHSLVIRVGAPADYLITGRALTQAGVPLVNAQIRDDSGRLAFTDSDGRYTFGRLSPASYVLNAFRGGRTLTAQFANPLTVGPNAAGADFALVGSFGPGSGVMRELWTGITGNAVSDLTRNVRYPNNPDSTGKVADAFEGPENSNDNYGERYRGYFIPPQSGGYTFYIASDDASELWLSRNEDAASRVRIAYLTGWTGSRNWTANASQKSALVQLAAGQRYYIEALHKEGGGDDNLAVGVDLPDGSQERPIPAHRLDPYPAVAPAGPEVSVYASDPAAAEPNDPGAFEFTRTGSTDAPLDVYFEFAGTAAYGADYSAPILKLTIPAGQTTSTLPVHPLDDSVSEVAETVEVSLVPGTNYLVGAAATATVSIADNDGAAMVSVIATDPSASKTTRDPAQFTIYRAGNSSSDLLVNISLGGTAAAGTDYTAITNQVLIPAGQGMATVTVLPSTNLSVESLKTVTLVLAAGTGYTVGSPNSATVRITEPGSGIGVFREYWTGIGGSLVSDLTSNPAYPNSPSGSGYLTDWFDAPRDFDDSYGQRVRGYFVPPVSGYYRFFIASDDGGELWFSPTLPANRVRIAYVNGWVNYHQWTAQANQASSYINLTAGQRYYLEALQKEGGGGDHLSVGVLMPGNWYERPISAEHLEPWSPSGSLVYIKATQPTAFKSGQPGRFVVRRTGDNSAALLARVSIGGTAWNGTDYTAIGTTVLFVAGSSEAEILVTPIPDGIVEPAKTVTLTLQSGTGYDLGYSDSATVTIFSDPPLATVSASDPVASEPGTDPGTFRIALNGVPFGGITINYAVEGTAVPGLDYAPLAGTVGIAAAQTVAYITVNPLVSPPAGSSNTVVLKLAPGNGYSLNVNTSATVSLVALPQAPFTGVAATLPGTIQVEDFDTGGINAAYYDTTLGNAGNVYRLSDSVDLEATSDTDGGYDVTSTAAGEWLEYSVNVLAAGSYNLDTRLANSAAGGSFRLDLDRTNLTGSISVPNTGGLQTWQTVTASNLILSAGPHILRLTLETNAVSGYVGNFNWIRFAPVSNNTPVLASIQDRVIMAGTTLTVTNSAVDPDAPPQVLTFSLASAPENATIGSDDGVLSWRPTISQSPSTNLFVVSVSDNGSPVLSATQQFTVSVLRPVQPTLGQVVLDPSALQLLISGDTGPDYSVLTSTNLLDWVTLVSTNSPELPWLFTDPDYTNFNRRFYRVLLGP